MIHIRAYKGYNIEYDEDRKKFFGQKGNETLDGYEREEGLSDSIDRHEEEIAEMLRKAQAENVMKELGDVVFTITAPDLLYYCTVLKAYLNEATAHISSTQLWSCGLDPANVVLVKVGIPLTCNKPNLAEFRVGLGLTQLYTLVSNTQAKQFKLRFNTAENTCTISDGFGSFTMHTVDPYDKPAKVPELDYTNSAKMDASVFRKFITYADRVAESVFFIAKDNQMHFEAEGDLNKYVSPPFGQVYLTEKKADSKSKFSIEYLLKLRFTGLLTIELRTDYPLRLTDEQGNILVLAPRVAEE